MLPNAIELDLAAERREETVVAGRREEAIAAELRGSTESPHVAPARRVVGRWFMAVGARLAGEPPLRLARSSRG